jgi:hypothetical protein
MSERVDKELRSSFARATRAGHRAATSESRAAHVHYRALENALHFTRRGSERLRGDSRRNASSEFGPAQTARCVFASPGGDLRFDSANRLRVVSREIA